MPFSGGDNWTQKPYVPHYDKTLWLENGKEIAVPEGFYSSKFIVDKAIQQLENNQKKPSGATQTLLLFCFFSGRTYSSPSA